MKLPNTNYELQTTFWDDFSIADIFGTAAVQDTYDRTFAEWKSNCICLTELAMVLNHKIWQWYRRNDNLARLYNNLWSQAAVYAEENLQGSELEYYLMTTD